LIGVALAVNFRDMPPQLTGKFWAEFLQKLNWLRNILQSQNYVISKALKFEGHRLGNASFRILINYLRLLPQETRTVLYRTNCGPGKTHRRSNNVEYNWPRSPVRRNQEEESRVGEEVPQC
jgi:hypothetical protein